MRNRVALVWIVCGIAAALSAPAAAAAGPCGTSGPLSISAGTASCTYTATAEDTFTVPDGVTDVQVDAIGAPGTIAHDYKRHRTTTLFAALNTLDGSVIGQCLPRHRHQEFLKFLRRLDREFPRKLELHLIVDNYQVHKHPNVEAWLEKHPRFHLHFTPTSSSWLTLVEHWFAELTNKAIRRGVFQSVPDLITAIETYLANYNHDATPFTWTQSADAILEKIARARAAPPDPQPDLSTQL